MFINASPILGVLDMYRLIWISGRFGGHKTALAFQIARSYLEKGYRLATNCRCVWADDLDNMKLNEKKKLHAVCVLDEGGLFFKSSKQIERIASFAAKMDVIYIIPSFWPPTKSAQVVNIQPIVSLKATGLPIIIYKWKVNIGVFKENGWFIWWNPREIYGIYSRQDPGDDPDEIVEWLIERTDEYRKAYGRGGRNELFELEEISEGDKILEAAEIIGSGADEIAAVSGGRRKRRR